jgi:predicted DNA-binding protein
MSHRTQITLTDEQYQRLKEESERTGLALSELVRRAIERTYGQSREDWLRALDVSFGAWKDRDFDGESYVEAIRQGVAARLKS